MGKISHKPCKVHSSQPRLEEISLMATLPPYNILHPASGPHNSFLLFLLYFLVSVSVFLFAFSSIPVSPTDQKQQLAA
jgi:Zn-dependent protease